MAFSWLADDGWLGGFVIFQGIPNSIAKKPYIFVIFQGGEVLDPYPPSGSAHEYVSIKKKTNIL